MSESPLGATREEALGPYSALRWYALCCGLICIDQITKFSALAALQTGSIDLLPFLSLRLACNTGAAFSILQGYSTVLSVVGVVFGVYFAWLIWKLRPGERVFGLVYSLILAGAIGNVIDRTLRGCVVDFVHVHYGWFNFPVFNFADSAITVGATTWFLWLVVDIYRTKRQVNGDRKVET